MTADAPHIVIIGGGITGLAAAYYAQQQARTERRQIRITLIEGDRKLGGKVQTERHDGLVMEQGPDSFLTRKPAARELAEALGLGDELVGTNPHVRKTYMVHRRQLKPLPETMMLAAPTDLGALARAQLLSPLGKARLALDFMLPPSRSEADESLGCFLTRRLGREAATNLAGPLLSGIYAGNMDELSVMSTFPQLRQLEHKHGSLLRGLRALRAQAGQRSATGSAFLTVRTGLATLVEAVSKALDNVDIVTGDAVTALTRHDTPVGKRFQLKMQSGRTLQAAAVICTVPAPVAGKLLEEAAPDVAAEVAGIRHVSTASVVLVYAAAATARPLDATGFLVPPHERQTITGATWVTQKWPHTTTGDRLLIRCFVGRAGSEDVLAQDDATIVQAVAAELGALAGLHGEPLLSRVYRWPQAMPQYVVGHGERLGRIEQKLAAVPGLYVAGAGYDGIGLPDCIRQGRAAATAAIAQLSTV